jgi:hypothetical protein
MLRPIITAVVLAGLSAVIHALGLLGLLYWQTRQWPKNRGGLPSPAQSAGVPALVRRHPRSASGGNLPVGWLLLLARVPARPRNQSLLLSNKLFDYRLRRYLATPALAVVGRAGIADGCAAAGLVGGLLFHHRPPLLRDSHPPLAASGRLGGGEQANPKHR